jgi:hypothetical protein
VDFGQSILTWRFTTIWHQLAYQINRKNSFLFRKEFLYFSLSLHIGSLGKGSYTPQLIKVCGCFLYSDSSNTTMQ